MTLTTKHAAGREATALAASAAADTFILTLCRLDAPVAIRPPQSPQLARFKFFLSRTRHGDGTEHLHLNMGYFSTRQEAEKCAQIIRARYPQAAVAALAPRMSPQSRATTQTNGLSGGQPPPEPPVLQGISPAKASALTDTQVLQILEKRRVPSAGPASGAQDRPEIALLRPDDTNTRRALKEAVAQGTDVSFVVQLCQSERPIELKSLPALDIFRAYRLYLAQGDHQGRHWHALRLGFFSDAESAKQVAYYARTSYATVAVVPIAEGERAQAGNVSIALTHLAAPSDPGIDKILAADQPRSGSPPAAARERLNATQERPRPIPAPKERRKDGLEQTLELLAASELWNGSDSDSLSETGVRHLKFEVQKRSARKS